MKQIVLYENNSRVRGYVENPVDIFALHFLSFFLESDFYPLNYF